MSGMWTGTWWKALVIALLVLPPLAYVAGALSSRVDAPEQRPALVLDDGPSSPTTERQVTLAPRPRASRPPAPARDDALRGDGGGSDDDRDSDDGDADRGDGGVAVVRPVPQEADDSADDDDSGDDDADDRDGDDSRGDDGDD